MESMKPLFIFDMDGVLVDVTESYRETIAQTAAHFTARPVGNHQIQEYKNRGGFNDDWKLTHQIVRDAGVDAPFEDVKAHFQKLFHGGLMQRERWIAREGMLERLAERFRFAIFTGRPNDEVRLTLDRFAALLTFDPVLGMQDVTEHKPHPEGLLRIAASNPGTPMYYIGDTVDDARAARGAKMSFIGVAAPSNPAYLDLVFHFHDEKSFAIVDDINYLEEVFPA
jgi:HAD superfamily phosphatase